MRAVVNKNWLKVENLTSERFLDEGENLSTVEKKQQQKASLLCTGAINAILLVDASRRRFLHPKVQYQSSEVGGGRKRENDVDSCAAVVVKEEEEKEDEE